MATSSNVTAGKPKLGGAIFKAPTGTTLPTDATATLNQAFKSLGYCSDDGVKSSTNRTVNNIKAWGGETVMTTQTEYEDTFNFKLIEALNEDVLKTVYGDANVVSNKISVNAKELPTSAWVIELVLTGNKARRIVIPNGKVTTIGEVTYSDNEAVGYDITVTAFPDDSGNTHYIYNA